MAMGKRYSDEQEGFKDKIENLTTGIWNLGRGLELNVGNSLREEIGCLCGEPSMGLGWSGGLIIKMAGEP